MEFFNGNNLHLLIAVVLSAINGVLLCFLGSRFFQVIQLGGYKISSYKSWLKETKSAYICRLLVLCFLSVACVLVSNALLDGYGEYYSYIGLIFYFYFCIVFIVNVVRMPQKTPLKQTKRMSRLIIVSFLVLSVITFFLIAVFSEYVKYVKFGIVAITPMVLPVIIPLCHFIMIPFELLNRQYYINKAKKKLKSFNNLIKIGITGSYGKTTTKHILNVMLSKKYNVCMSPHSFNTPMGLTKVVNNFLKPEHEVLIAEMGAKNIGDIAYLCKIIEPKHAIITSVSSQHLSTFKTLENVYKAKSELMNSISDGVCCFNAQNAGANKMFDECKTDKILCGLDNDNCYVNIKNITVSTHGSTFDLCVGSKTVNCSTKLIGKHNIEDIAMSAGIAHKLGVSLSQIKSAIASLKPVANRMELIEENGLTIIDNSYNSSVESSISSLETLSLFEGDKIVITPGLVELGDIQEKENTALGKRIAEVANKVIIVNITNKQAILNGLKQGEFSDDNIIFADTLNEAKIKLKTIAKEHDVILFENDLPDNYL